VAHPGQGDPVSDEDGIQGFWAMHPAVAACFASGIVIFLLFISPPTHIDLL
jgi:hypothetical protein